MNRTVCFMMAVLVSLNLFNGPLHAAQPAFEGKTIRIVVGFSAGGGFERAALPTLSNGKRQSNRSSSVAWGREMRPMVWLEC